MPWVAQAPPAPTVVAPLPSSSAKLNRRVSHVEFGHRKHSSISLFVSSRVSSSCSLSFAQGEKAISDPLLHPGLNPTASSSLGNRAHVPRQMSARHWFFATAATNVAGMVEFLDGHIRSWDDAIFCGAPSDWWRRQHLALILQSNAGLFSTVRQVWEMNMTLTVSTPTLDTRSLRDWAARPGPHHAGGMPST